MKEYLFMFKYTFDYMGVANKREYWLAILVNCVIWIILLALLFVSLNVMSIIMLIYAILTILPLISLTIRRLHDADHYGYNIFWWFVPIAGVIISIKLLMEPTKYNLKQ